MNSVNKTNLLIDRTEAKKFYDKLSSRTMSDNFCETILQKLFDLKNCVMSNDL